MINTIPIAGGIDVAVSRSKDGLHWNNPIFVSKPGNADKNWIICDNAPTSPYFGNCYVGWDNSLIQMTTSTDGGLTWSSPKATAGFNYGIGINPVVQPNGNVVVGFADYSGGMSALCPLTAARAGTRQSVSPALPVVGRMVACAAPVFLLPPLTAPVTCTFPGRIVALNLAAAPMTSSTAARPTELIGARSSAFPLIRLAAAWTTSFTGWA